MKSPNQAMSLIHDEAVFHIQNELRLDIAGQSVKVCWQEWGQAQKNVLPVLCLHAINRVSDDFATLASFLASTRRVICPDLPGRGCSDHLLDPALYQHQTYLQVIEGLLLAAGLGADQPIDIVGTSLGGLLGIQFAAKHPNRVRKLILNDVGTFTSAHVFAKAAASIAKPLRLRNPEQAVLIFKVMTAACGPLSDEQWSKVSLPMVCSDGQGAFTLRYDCRIAEQLAQDAEKDLDLHSLYQKITAQVLLIRGEKSDVVSAENAQQMQESGPRAQILNIPETGHFPMLVKDNELIAVQEFLARAYQKCNQIRTSPNVPKEIS